MTPYVFLILIVSFSPAVARVLSRDKVRARYKALIISLFAVFLLFALRAPTVGRDIPGYLRMYDSFSRATINNFDLYWTESGYELLELLGKKYLNLPWQLFMAIVYGFITISYYHFFKNYSENPVYSVLIYIFLGYMIFDMSAVRTALSLSICLYAVPQAQKRGFRSILLYVIIVLIAAQIHRGAHIFLMLYFVQKIKISRRNIIIAAIIPLFMFVIRGPIVEYVITHFERNGEDMGAHVGGSALMYFSILILSLLTFYATLHYNNTYRIDVNAFQEQINVETNVLLPLKMAYFGALFQVFMGNITLVRMAQYGLIFMTILIPNIFNLTPGRIRMLLYGSFTLFLITFFYIFKVQANELDFLPYRFFWESGFLNY